MSTTDPEDLIGERVLLLLLLFAVVYAAVFLLLPFVTVGREVQLHASLRQFGGSLVAQQTVETELMLAGYLEDGFLPVPQIRPAP